MLKVSPVRYISLGEAMADISLNLMMADTMGQDDPKDALKPEEREEIKDRLATLRGACAEVESIFAIKMIDIALADEDDLPATRREFELLLRMVKIEIEERQFVFVPAHLNRYHENPDLLSEAARKAFPSATMEIRDGGNCLALGQGTASVFHSMRAAEHGLRALAAEVGVVVDVQMWGELINQIEAAISDERKKLPKGTAKSDRLEFLSKASSGFTHFKDGWRNHVMHTKTSYTEAQAMIVLDQVRIFLDALSAQLRETT